MILITGASGFIGTHLTKALVGLGDDVRALVRSEDAAQRLKTAVTADLPSGTSSGTLELVMGDVTDAESLAPATKGCRLVHHLAGGFRGSPAELNATHVGGTTNLFEALDEGTRVVQMSSAGVYGWNRSWPVDHTTPPRPASPYTVAKLAAERIALQWPSDRLVIARPSIVYGPGDTKGLFARVVKLLLTGVRRFPGTGRNSIQVMHIDDLVAALVRLGEEGDGVFVLSGPQPASMSHTLRLLADGAGLRPPAFGLPAAALRPLALGVESAWSAAGRGGEAPLSRHSVDVATLDQEYSWSRAAEVLGWRPRVTLEEGMPPTGAWLKEHLQSRRAPVSSVATTDLVSPPEPVTELEFDWRSYFEDPDEGLGTVYERFSITDLLRSSMELTGSESVLHAPLFGLLGIPGLDTVSLARDGVRVGLVDFDAERLAAVRTQWEDLGLHPQTHLLPGPDPASWPEQLADDYDLVFSFAALWYFRQPWEVLSAQARWARRGVLSCVPNTNVFMKLRANLWHRDTFSRVNKEALDLEAMKRAGQQAGLVPIEEGLLDMPPFPDTSVPLAKLLRAVLRKEPPSDGADGASEGAWAWSILPYLNGTDPELKSRIERLSRWERYVPSSVAPHIAHHRYALFAKAGAAGAPTGSQAAHSSARQS